MYFSSYWVDADSDDDIMHYGVKGMKWGVRKAEYRSMSRRERRQQRKDYKQKMRRPNASYTNQQKVRDYFRYGSGAPRRINEGLNQGLSRQEINKRERKRALIRAGGQLAIATAPITVPLALAGIGRMQVNSVLKKQAAFASRAKAAEEAIQSLKGLPAANVINTTGKVIRERRR